MAVEFCPHNKNFILTIVKNKQRVKFFSSCGPSTEDVVYI